MSPDQINDAAGKPLYRCRVCRTDVGLHWFNGTSCPLCDKPECLKFVQNEWAQAYEDKSNEDNY